MTVGYNALGRYFAARAEAHRAEAERVLAAMTERERALFREAAVMGYAQGSRGGHPMLAPPPDSQVVELVVGACLAMSDLYPIVDSLREGT